MLAVFWGDNGYGRPSYGNIQEKSCHHIKFWCQIVLARTRALGL